ncbi:hypothetical protein LZL87_014392 [Fusarium oxysporum]|nr:hypothetical protein LZL87_014392 [Fusarium oxysporum]
MSQNLQSKSRKTLERIRLADLITKFGFDVMPCSFCKAKGLRCKMIKRSSRCSECTRRGQSCDTSGVAVAHLPRLNRESDRLEQAEEEAEEKLLKAQQEVNEAIIRLSHIRRQKRLLRNIITQEEDAAILDI